MSFVPTRNLALIIVSAVTSGVGCGELANRTIGPMVRFVPHRTLQTGVMRIPRY